MALMTTARHKVLNQRATAAAMPLCWLSALFTYLHAGLDLSNRRDLVGRN
jgi:hypothetical protein